MKQVGVYYTNRQLETYFCKDYFSSLCDTQMTLVLEDDTEVYVPYRNVYHIDIMGEDVDKQGETKTVNVYYTSDVKRTYVCVSCSYSPEATCLVLENVNGSETYIPYHNVFWIKVSTDKVEEK